MADHIEIGDFIKADKAVAVFGIVTGEGTIGCVPCWKVDLGGGMESVMLKAYAVLIHKGDQDG